MHCPPWLKAFPWGVKNFLRYYLRCLDASIRWIGSSIIVAALVWGIDMLLGFLPFEKFFGSGSSWITAAVLLIVMPFAIRLGVIGGGLAISPLFVKTKAPQD